MEDSKDTANRQAIWAALDALGQTVVQDDAITFEGSAIVLPEAMAPEVDGAIEHLKKFRDAQGKPTRVARTFAYRPFDGAAAFDRAVRRVFGMGGVGKETMSFFGPQPPVKVEIATADGPLQVSWGSIEVPALGTFTLDATYTDNGPCFMLSAIVPARHRGRVSALFDVVQDELIQRSIYRGHALHGAQDQPAFLDLSKVDTRAVTYSDEVSAQLDANVWSHIRHADVLRRHGIPVRRAVLLAGSWGTGKSLACAMTGKLATEYGWTYILARPGDDSIADVMNLARQYGPAVVVFEDLDTVSSDLSQRYLSQLLDALDGVAAKGAEVLVLFTTNHADRIAKGVLRPGRVDAVIEFGALDQAGTERLVRHIVPAESLGSDVDWTAVAAAFTGYVPAFAVEAIHRAMRYTIARTGALGTVDTSDLVHAAQGLRAQVRLMDGADEGVSAPAGVEGALRDLVAQTVRHVLDQDTEISIRDDADVVELRANIRSHG